MSVDHRSTDSDRSEEPPEDGVEHLAWEYEIPLDRLCGCLTRMRVAFNPGDSSSEITERDLESLPVSLLLDAIKARGMEEGVGLIETADLNFLAQRIATFEYLADQYTPFYDRTELLAHLQAFLLFQDTHKDFLIRTGLPPRSFGDCPWLDLQLGRLYDTRCTGIPFPRTEPNEDSPYNWKKYPDDAKYLQSVVPDVPDYESASFLRGLNETDGRRLESLRERFFQVRRDILVLLIEALTKASADNVVKHSCQRLSTVFSKAEIEFLSGMDSFYLGSDFREHDAPQTSPKRSPGGLTNLLMVVGHVVREIQAGPFHHARQSMPNPVRVSLLADDADSHAVRYLRVDAQDLDQSNATLDELFKALERNSDDWNGFRVQVQEFLEPELRIPIAVLILQQYSEQIQKNLPQIVGQVEARANRARSLTGPQASVQTDDSEWVSMPKQELRKRLEISETTLRKWIKGNSENVWEEDKTSKFVKVRASFLDAQTSVNPAKPLHPPTRSGTD